MALSNALLSFLGFAPRNASLSGHIDLIRNGQLLGWAARRGDPRPVRVDLIVNGEVAFEGVLCELQRDDLAASGIGTGRHGFSLPVDPRRFGATTHIELRDTRSGAVITTRTGLAIEGESGSERVPGDADGATDPAEEKQRLEAQAEAIRPYFDERYYLQQLEAQGIETSDPLEHYLLHGWRLRLDPSHDFSTSYYLTSNPDVAEAGVNPFWHYVGTGRAEHRRAKPPGGYKAAILARLEPLEQQVQHWRRDGAPSTVVRARDLVAVLRQRGVGPAQPTLVSFSHDDYRTSVGGVQLCIGTEEREAGVAGYGYLHVSPWQPLPVPAREGRELFLNITFGGADLGVVSASGLIAALGALHAGGARFELVVHSLLGHAPEALIDLAGRCGIGRGWFWLHDYLSLCPGYTLQRNGITYCGAPPAASQACAICVYGEERQAHLARFERLFRAIRFDILAPSEAALGLWQAASSLPHGRCRVVPHVTLGGPVAAEREAAAPDDPVRVAYVGYIAPHKGWEVFRALVSRFARSPERFEFHYFGTADPGLAAVQAHHVAVTPEDRLATARALAAAGIDLVVLFSVCPETFSFTAHEALTVGAAVITSPASGNIARLVRQTGCGAVVPDQRALLTFFAAGEAEDLVARRRVDGAGPLAPPVFSRMTLSVLDGEDAG